MLFSLKNKPCSPMDLTVFHLTRKLKKLDRRIQKDSARAQDYINRERVMTQLVEAKRYLC